jgi:hypothetical protein
MDHADLKHSLQNLPCFSGLYVLGACIACASKVKPGYLETKPMTHLQHVVEIASASFHAPRPNPSLSGIRKVMKFY